MEDEVYDCYLDEDGVLRIWTRTKREGPEQRQVDDWAQWAAYGVQQRDQPATDAPDTLAQKVGEFLS